MYVCMYLCYYTILKGYKFLKQAKSIKRDIIMKA